MMEQTCNGIKLRALNPDCSRVVIKSSVQSSWMCGYKRFSMISKPLEHDIGIAKNELLVISFQDGSGGAAIEVEPLGDAAGTLVYTSNRNQRKTLRVGQKYRFEMKPGESIIMRSAEIRYADGTREKR
jgi:hypothetical protein